MTTSEVYRELLLGTLSLAKYWKQPVTVIDELSFEDYSWLMRETTRLIEKENDPGSGNKRKIF